MCSVQRFLPGTYSSTAPMMEPVTKPATIADLTTHPIASASANANAAGATNCNDDNHLFTRVPCLNWLFAIAFCWVYFGFLRVLSMRPLFAQFGPKQPHKNEASDRFFGLLLGLVQDLLLVVLVLVVLSGLDDVIDELFDRNIQANLYLPKRRRRLRMFKRAMRFVVYFVAFSLMVFASATDDLLLRTRWIRFRFDTLAMYFAQKGAADQVVVSKQEYTMLYASMATMFGFACVFGMMAMHHVKLNRYSIVPMFSLGCVEQVEPETEAMNHFNRKFSTRRNTRLVGIWVALGWYTTCAFLTSDIASHVNPLVSMIGLNTGLSELFRLTHLCSFSNSIKSKGAVNLTDNFHLEIFLDNETEDFALYGPHTVYRKTRGFKGATRFNVSVDPSRLPNVLIIGVESFRRRDSLYLSGGSGTGMNVSLTPNFDRYAKRNLGFRNFWSSWRTSRSLESLLFGQVAYDDMWKTGTTTGRPQLQLSGLPQFMKSRGYETIFTTGSRETYDNWDLFLPTHGFDRVFGLEEFISIAKDELGINLDIGKRMMNYWGLHDDVSFQVLQELLQQKQREQQNATATGKTRTPWFVTHYTISSHSPFEERPDWYANSPNLPDCSPLYRNNKLYAQEIRHECEMRFFTDLALGNFLDTLNATGILNDTLVVISGDHGQSPECGLSRPELCHVDATRVAGALIAEGRLGEYAGMVLDDATHQNDILPTLMDVIGVSSHGFVQSGVGRSLLRHQEPGKRVVFANIPGTQLASIQGQFHIEYTALWNDIQVYDIHTDPDQLHDLYESQTATNSTRREELEQIRDASRQINSYFKHRIDHNCILQPQC